MAAKKETRCSWCLGSDLYKEYHDSDWGVPVYTSNELFESLSLEGAQAGLSWITILNKRENYRRVFSGFDPSKVARFTTKKIDKLVLDPGIVRHRQKIEAVVANAKLIVAMEKNGESFVDYVWSFVDFATIQNKHKSMKSVNSNTDVSNEMSKSLKKRGFKFVGSTTCYSFMQASGMVNDHMTSCPRHAAVKKLGAKSKRPARWLQAH